jgi:hypothetical protein
MKSGMHIVGTAIRMEKEGDELYLVFHITDQKFKMELRENWLQDVELEIVGKNLVKE